VCCGKIPIKRYFLPIVFVPIVLIVYKELQNYVYIPVFLGISTFVLFWNFPWIVYYTASKPLYYQDLFIDEKKLPNYDVNPKLKSKFQNILIWVLIVSNSLLVAALGDYWLYSAIGLDATFEILGVTGGIIKIFQIINNTISRLMLKILKIFIRKENQHMRQLEIEKMRKLVKCNFNSTNQLKNNDFVSDEKKEDNSVEMVFNNDLKPYRDRLQTI
tara:strand:+ start:1445 stop:2092 length:648 start_codon:yes stop_codon:yes gene_type:complete